MSKYICLLLLSVASLSAESPNEETAQIGRYMAVAKDGELYLLDTATGQLWQEPAFTDKWKPWCTLPDSP